MTELLGCPFCGKEPTMHEHSGQHKDDPTKTWDTTQIRCYHCLATVYVFQMSNYGFSKEEAVSIWNSRKTP